jgi:hypothetical protein
MNTRNRVWRLVVPSLALSLTLGLAVPISGQSDVITRGPYLQSLLSTSVRVVWLTEERLPGAVVLGIEGQPTRRVEIPSATLHVVDIVDLEPASTYRYDVFMGDENLTEGAGFHFRTAPPLGTGKAHLVALGDSGTGGPEQRIIADLLCELQPDLFLHTGDLNYISDIDRALFSPYRETMASTCLYPSRGNHDVRLPWGDLFFVPGQEFGGDPVTFYTFDWAAAHFIVADTNKSLLPENEHIAWLTEALENASSGGQNWVILLFHAPPFNAGSHSSASRRIREALVPLFDRFEVDLVLSGHDHNYQRTFPIRDGVVHDAWQSPTFIEPRGTTYVVSGGGGQILYARRNDLFSPFTNVFIESFHLVDIEIFPNELKLRALGPGGEELDAFTIRKGIPRPMMEFLRADTNGSGRVDLVDVLVLLNFLFAGGEMACPTTGNTESGDGAPTLTDAIATLNYLFLGGPGPEPPFPNCGPAPLDDDAFCVRASCDG